MGRGGQREFCIAIIDGCVGSEWVLAYGAMLPSSPYVSDALSANRASSLGCRNRRRARSRGTDRYRGSIRAGPSSWRNFLYEYQPACTLRSHDLAPQWCAPISGTVDVLAVGGGGGSVFANNAPGPVYIPGGGGAAELVSLQVSQNEPLNISIGGAGVSSPSNPQWPFGGNGGSHGGANGGLGYGGGPGGAGGGGETTITDQSGATLVEAAGGGGAGGSDGGSNLGGFGGAGGGGSGGSGASGEPLGGNFPGGGGGGGGQTTNGNSGTPGLGGATACGNPSNDDGHPGSGGLGGGECAYSSGGGGGGGGGIYGGGGGGGGGQNFGYQSAAGGGGGGSSYVSSGATSLKVASGVNSSRGYVEIGMPGSLSMPAPEPQLLAALGLAGAAVSRYQPNLHAGEPVNSASGDLYETYTDVSVPGRGPGLTVSRTYNSLNTSSAGMFGSGWSSTYDMHLVVNGDGTVTITAEDGSQVTATPNGSGGYALPTWTDSSLTQNTNGTWSYVRQATKTFTLNSSGKLTGISDLNGYTTVLTYCQSTTCSANGTSYVSGQLETVTDAENRNVTFAYGSNGLVSSVTDPLGQQTKYCYSTNPAACSSSANLVSVTDPLQRVTTFGYQANTSLIQTVTNPNDGVTQNVYDSSGRVTQQTDPAGLITKWSYTGDNFSPAGGLTTITDPHHNVEAEGYVDGQLMSLTKGTNVNPTSTWFYGHDGSTLGQSFVTDPNGNTTTTSYDFYGNVASTQDASGNTTTTKYNALNEPLLATDPKGITTQDSYDANGNLTQKVVTGVGGSPIETTSDTVCGSGCPSGYQVGDLEQMTDPAGFVTNYTYDAYGDQASVATHPSSNETDTTTYVYDGLSRHVCQASPDATALGVACPAPGQPAVADTTTWTYDADNEVTSQTDPNGNTTSYAYDANGNRTDVTDPVGKVTHTVFDADNRSASVTTGYGSGSDSATRSGYDVKPSSSGSCSSAVNFVTYCNTQTDADGAVTVSYYDQQNRLIDVMQPSSGNTADTYDGAGNLQTSTTAAGTSTYAYYPNNQVDTIAYSNNPSGFASASNVAYVYDKDGQRTQMTDGTGTTNYSYDPLERLQQTAPTLGNTTTYGYNGDNQVSTIGYGSGQTVTYGFDNAGRITSVTDWSSNTTRYTYDASGNIKSETLPNGVVSSRQYDADNQVSFAQSSATTDSASYYTAMGYYRNADEQVYAEQDSGVPARGNTEWLSEERYDPSGRATTLWDGAATYDPAGNPTSLPGMTNMAYSSNEQLCWEGPASGSCASPPTLATSYSYGATGDRTASTPPSTPGLSLGDNQLNELTSVTSTTPSGSPTYALALGEVFTLAVRPDGSVWAWGDNYSNDLGTNSPVNPLVPEQIQGLSGATAVAAGEETGYTLKSDGTVWDWGKGDMGELGDGSYSGGATPVEASGLTDVVQIAAGQQDGYALTSTGAVYAWGRN